MTDIVPVTEEKKRSAANKANSQLFKAEQLLKLIDSKRLLSERLNIGRACYLTALEDVNDEGFTKDEALSEAFKLWDDYAKGTSEEWKKIGKSDQMITIKTLAWWAKLDNPVGYTKWHKSWVTSLINNPVVGINNLADIVYATYWLDFIFCNKVWYRYEGNRWFVIDKDYLCGLIVNDFSKKSERMLNNNKLVMIINKLSKTAKKSSIITLCQCKFTLAKFDDIKDKDNLLFAVRNGVIDLHTESKDIIKFRQAKPEDYLTKCSEVEYNTELTLFSDSVRALEKWFGQVFTALTESEFQSTVASYIKGGTDKKFPVWSGKDDNSKRLMKNFLKMILGTYCVTLPESIITKGSNSGKNLIINARLGFFQGVDSERKVKCDIIKELTSDDIQLKIRSKHIEVKNTCKFVLIGDTAPGTSNSVSFNSTWVSDPPVTEAEQHAQRCFKLDEKFETKMSELAEAGLYMIVNHWYPNYVEDQTTPTVAVAATAISSASA